MRTRKNERKKERFEHVVIRDLGFEMCASSFS